MQELQLGTVQSQQKIDFPNHCRRHLTEIHKKRRSKFSASTIFAEINALKEDVKLHFEPC